MFIGFGYDVHRLKKNETLILGGEKIPFHLGLVGHSDADVLIHALMDALLGAARLGDIGLHFPDSDPDLKGISSLILLKKVNEMLENRRLIINNIDITVALETPRLSPYFSKIRYNIADILNIKTEMINLKASTHEKMGFIGRGEGIAAYCVVLLENKE